MPVKPLSLEGSIMRMPLLALGLSFAMPAMAQHAGHAHSSNMNTHTQAHMGGSSYAGMQTRMIKALSAQQIADLRDGKGMSLALPAELNGYPGPSHVMEMAEALELSKDQLLQTERLFREMQTEAKAMGEQVIATEAELDRMFKEKKATLAAVQDATARAAQVQGRLRLVHLKYHLAMVEVLSSSQVARYNQLRGYQ